MEFTKFFVVFCVILAFVHAVPAEKHGVKGCGSSEEDVAVKPAIQAPLSVRNKRALATFAHTDAERQEHLKEEFKERALETAEAKIEEEREKAYIRN